MTISIFMFSKRFRHCYRLGIELHFARRAGQRRRCCSYHCKKMSEKPIFDYYYSVSDRLFNGVFEGHGVDDSPPPQHRTFFCDKSAPSSYRTVQLPIYVYYTKHLWSCQTSVVVGIARQSVCKLLYGVSIVFFSFSLFNRVFLILTRYNIVLAEYHSVMPARKIFVNHRTQCVTDSFSSMTFCRNQKTTYWERTFILRY